MPPFKDKRWRGAGAARLNLQPRRLLSPLRGWLGCVAVSFVFYPLSTNGAELSKIPPPAADTKQPPSVAAIADPEIIPRAEQALRSLQEIRAQVANDSTLSSIEKEFAAFTGQSDRRRGGEAEILTKSQSVPRINEILRVWNLEQSQLEDWDQALTEKSQALSAQEKRIDQILETWRATQAAVAKKFLFKALLQRRVEEVLREAGITRAFVQERATQLLRLQSQVADRLANLAKVRQEIEQARAEFASGLFGADSAPLWQALFGPKAQERILAEAANSPQRMLEDGKEFLRRYSTRIVWHLAFFFGLVGTFHFLRRALPPDPPPQLGAGGRIFALERPFSSSALLTLIPSTLFYPGAPLGILRIAVVPTVIAVDRLLPGFLPQKFQSWIRVLAGLVLLELLRSLLPEDWLLTRLLLLFIAFAGCIAIALFLRSRAAELLALGSSGSFIVLGIRAGLLLLAVSVCSNVVGNMSLAEILAGALIRISYAAAVIFAGAHLMLTLVTIGLQAGAARWLRSVRQHGDLIGFRCRVFIRFAGLALWAVFALYVVGLLGHVSEAGAAFLQLQWNIGAAEISVRDIAAFTAVLVSAVIVSRMLRFVLGEEILPRIRLPRGAPGAIDMLARYGVVLLGFFIALAASGADLSKVTLLMSALGIGIGFGLQSVVNNFVSGLILVFEHPLQVGDSVEVGTVSGEVRQIGFRASVIRTPDGADVVIPNGELVGGRFVNWSLADRLRRISIPVGVPYGSDPARIIDLLVSIAGKHPNVLRKPPPMAVFDRFGDSALYLTLFCWTVVDSFSQARSELTIAISKGFEEAGIKVPFPQHEVYVHWPDNRQPSSD